MVMPDKNPKNPLTDDKNKQNEKNTKEINISVDDALDNSEFEEKIEDFLAEEESPNSPTGATNKFLEINDDNPQNEHLRAKLNRQTPNSQIPLVTVEGENNDGYTPTSIIIYAHRTIPQDKNPLYKPNKCIEQIINESDKQQFKSEKGLTVYAPTSKQAYSLGEDNGKHFAKLSKDDAQTNGKIDYEIAGLTLMNMIENILSKGNVVKINTSDPIMACIGKSYIEYLEQKAGLECKFTLNPSIKYSNDQLETAKEKFKSIINQIGNQDFKNLPWHEAASRHQLGPPSARLSR